jgi:hypothetical protein
MTDWTKPALTDAYASVLTELMGRDTDAATQFVGSSSVNIPNGAIRWNPATYQWETYNASGGTWAAWATQISVGTVLLGSNSAAGTMQAVPRSQADSLYQPVGNYQPAGSYAGLTGTASNTFYANAAANANEGDIGAMTSGQPNAYLYNSQAAWGLYSPGAGDALISYTRAGGVVQVGSGTPITIVPGTAATHAATVGQLGNLSGAIAPAAGGVLPITAFGQAVQVNPGTAVTLPAGGTAGDLIYFYSGGAGYTIQADANHFIFAPTIGLSSITGGTVFNVGAGQDVLIMSRGVGEFDVIGGGALVVNAPNTFTRSQSAAVQAVAYAATITLDLTAGNDAAVTLTGNATLANPSAMTPGTSGHIAITQDTTGGRTMGYGSYWKFGSNGTPTLSTAANAEDVLVYWVRDATHIIASIVQGVQ